MKQAGTLNLIGGKAATGKTSKLVELANKLSKNDLVLFISLECNLEILISKYGLNVSNNIIVIDTTTNIEEIEKYINLYKPHYLLLDYLTLLDTRIDYNLKTLKLYSNNYDIDIYVSDYISSQKDISTCYQDTMYELCDKITIL